MNTTTKVIGLDLGDIYSQACVLDGTTAKVVERAKLRTTPAHVEKFFERRSPCRVVIEAGTHSSWMHRELTRLGHEVIIANPRKVRMRGSDHKDDRVDAEYLARMGRADPELLYPLEPRSERVLRALEVVRGREKLVNARTALINHVRGVVKCHGGRLPSSSTPRFHKLLEHVDAVLRPTLEHLMNCIEQLTDEIHALDRKVTRMCKDEFPETRWLRQVAGVGDLTALVYVLVIEDPKRFPNSRAAAAFVGLVPRRCQSGQSDPSLSIRKSGDRLLRKLLVQAAHYILGPFGPESELRRHGFELLARSGKTAKKRAVIAIARKLAVLLHALWKNQATYKPITEEHNAAA